MIYSIAVVGAGPVGTATAFQLARRGVPGVALAEDGRLVEPAAYRQAGGSMCWHRPDPVRAAAIKETVDFVRAEIGGGAPIRLRETPYLFLDTGVLVPAVNVAAEDLVGHLRRQAARSGVDTVQVGAVEAVERCDGHYLVVGAAGTIQARVVLLALGVGNIGLMPQLPPRLEKRQLFVLDLPVEPDRARLPHVVAPIGRGYAYLFIKDIDGELRVLLGQEDLVEDHRPDAPVDYLDALLATGLADRFPFLAAARTQQILWGLDWAGKDPHLATDGAGLLSLNCGSALRSCISLGRRAADAATAGLARTH
jgi:glycine/D-amino acid oxidase-like deaminating enzyme